MTYRIPAGRVTYTGVSAFLSRAELKARGGSPITLLREHLTHTLAHKVAEATKEWRYHEGRDVYEFRVTVAALSPDELHALCAEVYAQGLQDGRRGW